MLEGRGREPDNLKSLNVPYVVSRLSECFCVRRIRKVHYPKNRRKVSRRQRRQRQGDLSALGCVIDYIRK